MRGFVEHIEALTEANKDKHGAISNTMAEAVPLSWAFRRQA